MSVATLPPASPAPSLAAHGSLVATLTELYRQQAVEQPVNDYLRNHGRPRSIANHVRTFEWYRPFLPKSGAILDWGCQHAPDSCLLRAAYGDHYELHSCDFPGAGRHRVFHDFAATTFTPITEPEQLPFASQRFDAVIGSGVLEHVARDGDALREVYRVLKPAGILIITYLPNRWSINEWLRRVVWRRDFHRRLYGLREARRMLLHNGFYPFAARHHVFFWEQCAGPLAPFFGMLVPIQVFSSTLCLIGRKMRSM